MNKHSLPGTRDEIRTAHFVHTAEPPTQLVNGPCEGQGCKEKAEVEVIEEIQSVVRNIWIRISHLYCKECDKIRPAPQGYQKVIYK